jgi:hypothetical protein
LPFLAACAIARLGFGAMAGYGEDESFRETPRTAAAARRLVTLYVVIAIATLFLFPETTSASILWPMALSQAPLLAFAADPWARAAADWNAALLVAGANAAGGPVAAPTAAYLVLLPVGLALRRFEAAADAAGEAGTDVLSLPLGIGATAGAGLAGAYAGALAVLPAPALSSPAHGPRGRDLVLAADRPAPPVSWEALPWREIGLLGLALAALFAVFVAFVLIARRRQRGLGAATQQAEEGALDLGPAAPAHPAAPRPPPPAVPGIRGEVVALYAAFERALAAMDLGRAPAEGASEHAAALARRVQPAADHLAVVARLFASARYGKSELPADAPARFRAAADRALDALRSASARLAGDDAASRIS